MDGDDGCNTLGIQYKPLYCMKISKMVKNQAPTKTACLLYHGFEKLRGKKKIK